jgi:hypothetical protein
MAKQERKTKKKVVAQRRRAPAPARKPSQESARARPRRPRSSGDKARRKRPVQAPHTASETAGGAPGQPDCPEQSQGSPLTLVPHGTGHLEGEAETAAARAEAGSNPTAEKVYVEFENGRYYPLAVPLDELQRDPELLKEPGFSVPGIAAFGRVTMIAAREKMGKSTLAAFICAEASKGGTVWGKPIPQQQVLWVGLEEALGDATRRFVKLQADGARVHLVSRLAGSDNFGQLKAEIVHSRAQLVVIDSLTAFGKGLEDENSSMMTTRLLKPLVDWSHDRETATILLHHSAKSGLYRGSTAIGAAVDMIVEMDELGGDPCGRRLEPKGRFTAEALDLTFDPQSLSWTTVDPAAVAERLRERIVDLLRVTPGLGKGKIRDMLGGRGTVIDSAVDALVKERVLVHRGHKEGYTLA